MVYVILNRPITYHSQTLWPSELGVFQSPHFVIKINHVIPLSDPAQIEDVKTDFTQLEQLVCGDLPGGRRSYHQRAIAPHTYTEQLITCPQGRINLQIQKYVLSDAMKSLFWAQLTYGPGAITGKIVYRPDNSLVIGALSANIRSPPPKPRKQWPGAEAFFTFPIPDNPSLRLRVRTLGPTLDVWDTERFHKFCEEVALRLSKEGNARDPVHAFQKSPAWPFDGNLMVRYAPVPPAMPSRSQVCHVMYTLQRVIQEYGGRELDFYVVDDRDLHLGVGGLQFLPLPSQLVGQSMGGANNSSLLANVDGGNGTRDGNSSGATDET